MNVLESHRMNGKSICCSISLGHISLPSTHFSGALCLSLTPAPASFSGCFLAPAAIAGSNCVKLQHMQEKAFEFGRAFVAQAAVPDVPSEIWMEVSGTTWT